MQRLAKNKSRNDKRCKHLSAIVFHKIYPYPDYKPRAQQPRALLRAHCIATTLAARFDGKQFEPAPAHGPSKLADELEIF